MHTPQTERQALDAAISAAVNFIAGFEDDTIQDGVPAQILAQLRAITHSPAIVLEPPPAFAARYLSDTSYCSMWAGDFRVSFQRGYNRNWCTPWFGFETRIDQLGRVWERHFHAVIDDFGDLVEVVPC